MTVRGLHRFSPSYARSVHTRSGKFEKAGFFLRLGPSSTLIRHENGAFPNALQTGGILKRRLCVLM